MARVFLLVLTLLAGAAEAVTNTFIANGNWTAPAGVTSVTVEAWGGGGGGGAGTGNPAKGGGGAGGQYARKVVAVTPGSVYAVTVGAGGVGGNNAAGGVGGNSTFAATTVVARGGAGGGLASANNSCGTAGIGSVTGGVGDPGAVFAGGSGSACVAPPVAPAAGGAGGGGAGSTGAGGNAAGNTAGTGTATGGGAGGAGRTTVGAGNPGVIAGGAGGGGYATAVLNRNGGAGARGQVTITYTQPPVVNSINLASANPTTPGTSVLWTVIFSQSVTGVDVSDFSLVQAAGVSGASIVSVAGSGTTYTVTVNAGSGTGTLGLNLVDDDTIINATSDPLGGAGSGNGNFTGQVYSVSSARVYYMYFNPVSPNPGTVLTQPPVTTNTTCPTVAADTTLTVSGIGLMADVDDTTCIPAANRDVRWTTATPTLSLYYNGAGYATDMNVTGVSVGVRIRTNSATATVTAKLFYTTATNAKVYFSGTPATQLATSTRTEYTISLAGQSATAVPSGSKIGIEFSWNDTLGVRLAVNASINSEKLIVEEVNAGSTPVAEYRMDEASWNGIANEVIDSTANALHGAAKLGATTAIAKVCNGASLTANYVEVPDSAQLDVTSDLTVLAWVKPSRWGGAVGKDALMTIFSKDANYKAHIDSSGRIVAQWGANSLTSTGTVAVGAWSHVAVVYKSGSQVIYINGVASGTATIAGTLSTTTLPLQIGDDQGYGGGTRRFDGQVDEVKIFKGTLSSTVISGGYANENSGKNWDGTGRVCNPVDHVSIAAPDTEMTMNETSVTIVRHTAAHGAVNGAGTINLSTSTSQGDWTIGSGTGVLTPGAANSGSATYSFGAGESVVALGFTYKSAATVTINVADDLGANLLLNTPASEKANTIVFSVPNFIFTSTACTHNVAFGTPGQCVSLAWSPQIAGQTEPNIYITVLNASGVPTRLSATAIRTRNMQFGLTCHNPVVNAGKQATVSYGSPATVLTLPLCKANGLQPSVAAEWSTELTVSFPAGTPSSGPFAFNYADVGKVELWMRNSVATTQVGSSSGFVVKPGGFVLSAIKRTSDGAANPAAVDATGATFVNAGESFSVTVTATTCTPASATCTVAEAATPNYGKESSPESVLLTANLVAPVGGNNPGATGAFGAFSAGVATADGVSLLPDGVTKSTPFFWSEVGIITLTPSVRSGSYLAEGDVTGTTSGNVGRFYAGQFALSGGVIANRTDLPGCAAPAGCGAYTYMGEEMSAVFMLTAQAVDGTRLQNYVDAFAKFDPVAGPLNLDVIDNPLPPAVRTPLGARVSMAGLPAVTGKFLSTCTPTPACLGTANVTVPFMISRSASADGSYAALDVGIAPQDSDGAKPVYNLDTTNVVAGANNHALIGRTEVRYGRIKLSNNHGSELLRLPLTATVQYWNGTFWVTSATDSVTSLTLAATYDLSGAVNNKTTPTPAGAATVTNGILNISLAKPTGGAGSTTVVPTVPAYLPLTGGRATFGVYKGNNEFIYLRENY